MAIFRLINHLLETVRNKQDVNRSKWDAEYYGTRTYGAIEQQQQQQYHPTTYAAPGALPQQRKSCRELKQELRAERRRRKAERVAVRRERRDCRRGGGCRRARRGAGVVFMPETVSSGPARTQQFLHGAGRQNYHIDSVPVARSEHVRASGQQLPRDHQPVDRFGDGNIEEAPPAYEKVQTGDSRHE
ncbi:unnamed protein product [Clonostachys rosea]|uniref:Uncharacterized protein n=1 Tax=Bionectria ochroleuca TaxID=29856 RepID=A0ABY6TWT5_BIOOC|nr:unnamed protein product [Clonostachys rosea]